VSPVVFNFFFSFSKKYLKYLNDFFSFYFFSFTYLLSSLCLISYIQEKHTQNTTKNFINEKFLFIYFFSNFRFHFNCISKKKKYSSLLSIFQWIAKSTRLFTFITPRQWMTKFFFFLIFSIVAFLNIFWQLITKFLSDILCNFYNY
jgi:hypothetical protein